MDIVFLSIVIIAALLLPRSRALVVAPAAWAICVAFVGWGPANNSDVHTTSLGFWVPWAIVLGIGLGLVLGIDAVRRRRRATRA
ncbi:hypothetical protein BJ986_002387 [Phycicoccus badiiscoriae]|uniref:Uncharacterized protein n=1 Tax=Pedococcus badiiscoriae TaxID=642776 RepID=A0A852WGH0_9MICO|nr:hypothetical protein [Pedococcus badiiscoriae]NYG07900.1 hypothetical protein [Pedococcus badiiscoriae]